MVILGLGCNVGDRLANLRQAWQTLASHPQITIKHTSPVYQSDALLLDNSPTEWDETFFNAAVNCQTTLSPTQLLAVIKQIEQQMGRIESARWSPRLIDIDILMWHDLQLHSNELVIPHQELMRRPFALWPLMDLYSTWDVPREILAEWGSRFDGTAPLHTKQVPYRIEGPVFVGVLNVTPDSFSDGGLFNDEQAAVAQAQRLFAQGAEVIDIGAESTRPGGALITAEQEWQRLAAPLAAVREAFPSDLFRPKMSIDTRRYQVAQQAIALGADWINDVSGFSCPQMINAVRDADVDVVCMHAVTIPLSRDKVIPLDQDPVATVYQWAETKRDALVQQGIAVERVIFDIGIGFGKTPEQDLTLIAQADAFKALGMRLMVGQSRKSFHQVVTGVKAAERDLETAISSLNLFNQGIDYIRVHDVEYNVRAVAMQKRLEAVS